MALNRNEVPQNLKWNTSHIYETPELWESDYSFVENNLDFSKYQGNLNNANNIFDCMEAINKVMYKLEKLYVYASMRSDEDLRDNANKALLSRAQLLFVKFSSSVSFVRPELTSLSEEMLVSLANDPLLKDYDYTLKSILKAFYILDD